MALTLIRCKTTKRFHWNITFFFSWKTNNSERFSSLAHCTDNHTGCKNIFTSEKEEITERPFVSWVAQSVYRQNDFQVIIFKEMCQKENIVTSAMVGMAQKAPIYTGCCCWRHTSAANSKTNSPSFPRVPSWCKCLLRTMCNHTHSHTLTRFMC